MSSTKDDDPIRFETDIKPLFRPKDRESMRRHFDLGSHEDVVIYADRILERLRRGNMPCDGAWPPEQIKLFERWVGGGKLP